MSAAVLAGCRLYGILDLGYVAAADVDKVAAQLIAGGVDIIQLRAKTIDAGEIARIGGDLHSQTSEARLPLVINDYPEIARAVGAEGVHVGQDDLSVERASEIAGPDCFIGKSTHSLEQAKRAVTEGADYIGFGPLFSTPTKPNYTAIGLSDVEAVHAAVSIPIFCIGGIKVENLAAVLAAGAQRVVIVSGLLQASDIAQYARSAKQLLNRDSKIENRN